MQDQKNLVARRLIEAFSQFRGLNWRRSPVTGLKPSELAVLFTINGLLKPGSPGIKISDISSALRFATPTITQLVNGLETEGIVERTTDKEDRRAVRVNLTPKGQDVIDKASVAFDNLFNGLVEYLGEDKSNELAELLSKVFIYFTEVKKYAD